MARDLKLGLNTGYWSAGPPPGALEAVQEADRLGLDSIWTAEAYGSDVLTPLAWWGSHTQSVRLGTAIMQMSARTPAAAGVRADICMIAVPSCTFSVCDPHHASGVSTSDP